MAFERDSSKWKLHFDMGLLAILYCVSAQITSKISFHSMKPYPLSSWQGFVMTGASLYLQCWCIEKKGPVFIAMFTPLSLVFTIICSTIFLNEMIYLGRWEIHAWHHFLPTENWTVWFRISHFSDWLLQCSCWSSNGWRPLQCSLGKEQGKPAACWSLNRKWKDSRAGEVTRVEFLPSSSLIWCHLLGEILLINNSWSDMR